MKKPLRIVLCILLVCLFVCLLLVGIWCAVSYYMQKNLPTYPGEPPFTHTNDLPAENDTSNFPPALACPMLL